MDAVKQYWCLEETTCLLATWSSPEVQAKLEGATRTKPVLLGIQKEMAAAGYERSFEQINNKLKKLKKEYRDQKQDLGRSGNRRLTRKNPHFGVLDSVLRHRPAYNATGALNSATAAMKEDTREVKQEDTREDTREAKQEDTREADTREPTQEDTQSEPELSTTEDEDLSSPLHCGSSTPSSSSGEQYIRPRPAKRKRRHNAELLDYLERSDERFLQHSKDMTEAWLHRMEALNRLLLRMATVIEAQAKK